MLVRLAALLTLTGVCAPLAAAGDEPKPLRTLSYDVAFSMVTERERKLSGLNIENPDFSGGVAPNSQTQNFGIDDSGRMRLAVVAATGDGGLVVDESYDGKVTRQAPLRIAIVADGRLGHDPKQPPAPEALYVLPLLARGLVAGREIVPGTSWTVPTPGAADGTTTYRVTELAGSTATIAVVADLHHTGIDAFDRHDEGAISYDVDRLVPRALDIRTRLRRSTLDTVDITDTHVAATLISDSFATR